MTIIVGSVLLFLFKRKHFLKCLLVCLLLAFLFVAVFHFLHIYFDFVHPMTPVELRDCFIDGIVAILLALFVGTFVSVLVGIYLPDVRGSEKDRPG